MSKAFSRLLRHDDRIASYVDARVPHYFLMSVLQRDMAFDSVLPLLKVGTPAAVGQQEVQGYTP